MRNPTLATQYGFTYLAALFAVAILGAVLAATGIVWHTAQQREKEQQLLFIGEQFRTAIGLYYEKTPGAVKKYPNALSDLLKDNRYLTTERYLRRIYLDPMTLTDQWGIVKASEGGIMGVHSLSQEAPRKSANFSDKNQEFTGKTSYAEWQFVYRPVAPGQPSQAALPRQ